MSNRHSLVILTKKVKDHNSVEVRKYYKKILDYIKWGFFQLNYRTRLMHKGRTAIGPFNIIKKRMNMMNKYYMAVTYDLCEHNDLCEDMNEYILDASDDFEKQVKKFR